MARSDLLVSLVRAGASGDSRELATTVEALIAEERANPIPAESSMPEYPLLPLPAFERGDAPGGRRFVPSAPSVGRGRQGERLGPIFERLANVLEEDHDGLSLLDDPSSIAPERALVLEVAGSVVDFQALAARVEGLEFLGDEEIEFEPDEDFFEPDTRKGREGEPRTERPLGGRVYVAS